MNHKLAFVYQASSLTIRERMLIWLFKLWMQFICSEVLYERWLDVAISLKRFTAVLGYCIALVWSQICFPCKWARCFPVCVFCCDNVRMEPGSFVTSTNNKSCLLSAKVNTAVRAPFSPSTEGCWVNCIDLNCVVFRGLGGMISGLTWTVSYSLWIKVETYSADSVLDSQTVSWYGNSLE